MKTATTKKGAVPMVAQIQPSEPTALPPGKSLTIVEKKRNPVFEREGSFSDSEKEDQYRVEQIGQLLVSLGESAIISNDKLASKDCVWQIRVENAYDDEYYEVCSSLVYFVPIVRRVVGKTFLMRRDIIEEDVKNEMIRIELPHEHEEGCEFDSCPCTCGRPEMHSFNVKFGHPEAQQALLSSLDDKNKRAFVALGIDTMIYHDVRTRKKMTVRFKKK